MMIVLVLTLGLALVAFFAVAVLFFSYTAPVQHQNPVDPDAFDPMHVDTSPVQAWQEPRTIPAGMYGRELPACLVLTGGLN